MTLSWAFGSLPSLPPWKIVETQHVQGTASESKSDRREEGTWVYFLTVRPPGFQGARQRLVSDAVTGSPGVSTCHFLRETQASHTLSLGADEGLMKCNTIESVGWLCRPLVYLCLQG